MIASNYLIINKRPQKFADMRIAGISGRTGLRPSIQDSKINSYAWSIADKLDQGVKIRVTDAVDGSEMTVCPDCGMMNPNTAQYCLECGAEL